MNLNIDSLKRGLLASNDTIKKSIDDREQVLHNIENNTSKTADSTSNIENDVSDIKAEIISLTLEVKQLKQDLKTEKLRAEEAEKKAISESQRFSVIVAVFGVVISIGLPLLIAWIQSLLQ